MLEKDVKVKLKEFRDNFLCCVCVCVCVFSYHIARSSFSRATQIKKSRKEKGKRSRSNKAQPPAINPFHSKTKSQEKAKKQKL